MKRVIAVAVLMLFVGTTIGFADVTKEELQRELKNLQTQYQKTQDDIQKTVEQLKKQQDYLQLLTGAILQVNELLKDKPVVEEKQEDAKQQEKDKK